jgi:hypothetical protein
VELQTDEFSFGGPLEGDLLRFLRFGQSGHGRVGDGRGWDYFIL